MIVEVTNESREWPKSSPDWDNRYFEGILNGYLYARLRLQYIEDVCYIHLKVTKWSGNVLRTMRRDLETLKKMNRKCGVTNMVGVNSGDGLDKWCKMLASIGFPKPIPTVIEGIDCMMTVLEI